MSNIESSSNLPILYQCPVCNAKPGKNSGCRFNSRDRDWFYCRKDSSSKMGDEIMVESHHLLIPGKYICLGNTKQGYPCWKHEGTFQKQEPTNSAKKSRVYQAFPDKSFLYAHHREHLKTRGLSDEQINLGRFRSLIESYCNDYFCKGKDGFDCPIWAGDQVGTVNYQTRWLDTEDAKYTWAVFGEEGKWGKKCLPLTYVDLFAEQRNQTGIVYACEGLLKPFVAYMLLSNMGIPLAPFLGASGGNFKTSKEYLLQLVKKYAIKDIVYFPDAGWQSFGQSSKNGVFGTVDDSLRLFKEIGLKTSIASWGQWADKEAEDIDEYLAAYGAEAFLDIDIFEV